MTCGHALRSLTTGVSMLHACIEPAVVRGMRLPNSKSTIETLSGIVRLRLPSLYSQAQLVSIGSVGAVMLCGVPPGNRDRAVYYPHSDLTTTKKRCWACGTLQKTGCPPRWAARGNVGAAYERREPLHLTHMGGNVWSGATRMGSRLEEVTQFGTQIQGYRLPVGHRASADSLLDLCTGHWYHLDHLVLVGFGNALG